MRIISGKFGGLRLTPPNHLPVRPTTDIAKEALFKIMDNRMDFGEAVCLDLFAGTGNISFELVSRGARSVESIDLHFKCIQYISETCKKLGIEEIKARKGDVLRFIQTAKECYDFIFADPPYDLAILPQLANRILEKGLLKEGGVMVIEHPSTRKMDDSPYFVEVRKYGYSSFSFYTLPKSE